MSRQALIEMIEKFEETGDLDVMRGRGRKQTLNGSVKEEALDAVESESVSQCSASSARVVLRDLSFPWCTVQKIFMSSLKWYPYKISFTQQLNPVDSEKRQQNYFVTNFLARIFVDNEWQWKRGTFYAGWSNK